MRCKTNVDVLAQSSEPGWKLVLQPFHLWVPANLVVFDPLAENPTVWRFGATPEVAFAGLRSLLASDEYGSLHAQATVKRTADGCEITPPDDWLIHLSPESRGRVYRQLGKLITVRSSTSSGLAFAVAIDFRHQRGLAANCRPVGHQIPRGGNGFATGSSC